MQTWLKNWRLTLLPGLSITTFIIFVRLLGLLQPLEWAALDLSLRKRPAEPADSRIITVNITEEDIQKLGWPIPDDALAKLTQTLQTYQPRAIGIDIFRDQPVGEGNDQLKKVLQAAPNVIGIEKIGGNTRVRPWPLLPDEQIGFADALLDRDGFLRRSLLAQYDDLSDYRLSFTVRLAQMYIAQDRRILKHSILGPDTIRFGNTEILRFQPNTGSYIRANNGGNQTLINFRSGDQPFTQVSYAQLMSNQVAPELIRDKVVLVGYTAESVKDFVSSGAIATDGANSLIPGITIQAHAVSQILSAVYEGRPFLRALPDRLEYLLILSAGVLGMALAHWRRRLTLHWLIMVAVGAGWLLLGYVAIVASWWLPTVPAIAAFLFNAVLLYPFYQVQAYLRSQIDDQEEIIDQTYSAIHNGPLQVISVMLSNWPENSPELSATQSQIQIVNQELRGIREFLQQEMHASSERTSERLAMVGEQAIDLQVPLNTMLYQVYKSTVKRYCGFFELVVQVTAFEPMADGSLTGREKRALGRFLEEALTNIYKYAEGTTQIKITCQRDDKDNFVQIIDNGAGLHRPLFKAQGGYGTKQAHQLARQLGGKFERTEVQPQGVCCELRWPVQRPDWNRWR